MSLDLGSPVIDVAIGLSFVFFLLSLIVSGFTEAFDNVGAVRNKGVELALTTVNVDSRRPDGFRWSTTLNLAVNRNKVTELFNDQPFNSGERSFNRVEVGHYPEVG